MPNEHTTWSIYNFNEAPCTYSILLPSHLQLDAPPSPETRLPSRLANATFRRINEWDDLDDFGACNTGNGSQGNCKAPHSSCIESELHNASSELRQLVAQSSCECSFLH